MILRAKILLLWLLALAIPVQGFAAVLQAGCAPVTQVDAQVEAPMHHNMHTMHGMDHDMSMAAATSAADDHPSPHLSHKAGSTCSSCATCNVGAVLPLALVAPPSPELPSHRYLTLPSAGFVGFTPENPDRPPALA